MFQIGLQARMALDVEDFILPIQELILDRSGPDVINSIFPSVAPKSIKCHALDLGMFSRPGATRGATFGLPDAAGLILQHVLSGPSMQL